MKTESKKLSFLADRFSGVEACIFTMSIVLEVFRHSNTRNKFETPFYALTFNAKSLRGVEWIDHEAYVEKTDEILKYIENHGLEYFEDLRAAVKDECEKLLIRARDIKDRLSDLSDEELVGEYDSFVKQYASSYGLGAVTFLYESIVSERLHDSLSKRYSNSTEAMSELFFTGYKSFMLESDELLEKIRDTGAENQNVLIEEYLHNFFYMATNYADLHIMTKQEVLKKASSVHPISPKEVKRSEKLELNPEEKRIVDLLKLTEAIRDQRKRTNLIGNFISLLFLEEVCKRRKIEFGLAKRLFWFELKELMSDSEAMSSVLNQREKASAVLANGNFHYLDYDALVPRDDEQKGKICKGTPACSGKVIGKASIILGPREFASFNPGDILITEMTRPDFLPIMRKAKAIITDEGGLTCHAAIVSRELGIPCIVGVKNATRVFHAGDEIEVDAEEGVVRIIQ